MKNELSQIVGVSSHIKKINETVKKVANTKCRVFITGEEGTGKTLVALAIHELSERENFITVTDDNFADIKEGTLFFKEIMSLSKNGQAKLLSLIGENGENIRIIAATKANIDRELATGRLNSDLYQRLNITSIDVPALRNRKEDIPLLCENFIDNICSLLNHKRIDISEKAMTILQSANWEGNVKQLKKIMEWLIISQNSELVSVEMLPTYLISSDCDNPLKLDADIISMPLREARQNFEQQYLKAQISRFGGNISKTADFIKMERSALHRKLKNLGVYSDS